MLLLVPKPGWRALCGIAVIFVGLQSIEQGGVWGLYVEKREGNRRREEIERKGAPGSSHPG